MGARARRRDGFTLLEMAVVVAVIALITAAGAGVGRGLVEQALHTQTRQKLDRIEEALLAFRLKNNRLPCPAAQSDLEGSATYGAEADVPGSCAGGAPAATYVTPAGKAAEGAVPFAALGLTEPFMYDGWGRRFTYAVSTSLTGIDALSRWTGAAGCEGIRVRDAAAADRTDRAAYALVSHGPNGHGGFTPTGTRNRGPSTNADELLNCNCDGEGVFDGTYDPTYVQRDPGGEGAGAFDDAVRFKEVWQMRPEPSADTYRGAELVVNYDTELRLYRDCGGRLERMTDAFLDNPVTSLWPFGGYHEARVEFSHDNSYLYIGSNSLTRIYKLVGEKYTLLPTPEYFDIVPNDGLVSRQTLSFSNTGHYLALISGYSTGAEGQRVYFYKRSRDAFNRLAGQPDASPGSPCGGCWGWGAEYSTAAIGFSKDDRYFAASWNGEYYIYKRNGDIFTRLSTGHFDPAAVPAFCHFSTFRFSPDGRYFVGQYAQSGTTDMGLCVYKIDEATDTFTLLGTPPIQPHPTFSYTGDVVAFSPDSRMVILGSYYDWFLYTVDPATDTFTLAGLYLGGSMNRSTAQFNHDGTRAFLPVVFSGGTHMSNVNTSSGTASDASQLDDVCCNVWDADFRN